MASKKKDTPKDDKKGYQPKATARHAKMTKTRQEEIDALKQRIETDKHLAKKAESSRRKEIKALPKEDRPAAKAELKESVQKRKDNELKEREKLRAMINEERTEKVEASKDSFDEDEWIKSGRKNKKRAEKDKKE